MSINGENYERKTRYASRHFLRCCIKANKASKNGERNLNKHIIFESVLMLFSLKN